MVWENIQPEELKSIKNELLVSLKTNGENVLKIYAFSQMKIPHKPNLNAFAIFMPEFNAGSLMSF